MTDTQMLNWLESQGIAKRKWIARPSVMGRGYRLHQVTPSEAVAWGEKLCADTPRGAIEIAFAESMKWVEALRNRTCRPGSKPEDHAAACGLVDNRVGNVADDRCACGCTTEKECQTGAAGRK